MLKQNKLSKVLIKEYRVTPITTLNKIFNYVLVIYLLLLLIDQFEPIKFINLTSLLIILIILGIIVILFSQEKIKLEKPKKSDYYLIYFLGILGAILIYLKIKEIGWLSYLTSLIGGALIAIISKLFLEEENGKDN